MAWVAGVGVAEAARLEALDDRPDGVAARSGDIVAHVVDLEAALVVHVPPPDPGKPSLRGVSKAGEKVARTPCGHKKKRLKLWLRYCECHKNCLIRSFSRLPLCQKTLAWFAGLGATSSAGPARRRESPRASAD